MIRIYSRLIVFAFALLIGVQIPTVLELNERAVETDHKLLEKQMEKVRKMAGKEFYGSVDSLIEFYTQSDDGRLRKQGAQIESIKQKYDLLGKEQLSFKQPLALVTKDILLNLPKKPVSAFLVSYDYQPKLNLNAILFGLTLAVIFTLLVEILLMILIKLFRPSKQSRMRRGSLSRRHF